MSEHRDFKFGVKVDHSKSQPTDGKLSLKEKWSRHVTHFKFLVISSPINISLGRLKLKTSWMVQKRGKEIQDGGRPPFKKKSKNREISATIGPMLTKFSVVMHFAHHPPWTYSQPLIFPEFKNPRWPPAAILKNGNITM